MQRQLKHRMESAIYMGIIALLVVSFISFMGHDIHARAIYEDSPNNENNQFFWTAAIVIITIISVIFVVLAFRTLSFHNKIGELQGPEIREFVLQCMNRGYSREEAIELLVKNGWAREEISDILY